MSATKTVMFKELLNTVRDRRTLMISVVVPILMMPLLMFAFTYLTGDDTAMRVHLVATEGAGADIREVLTSDPLEAVSSADPAADLRTGDLELIAHVTPDGAGHAVNISHTTDARSLRALEIVTKRLEALNRELSGARLVSQGLDPRLLTTISVSSTAESTERQWSAPAVLFPLVIIVWAMMGAMYPAADVTAGEKERKTLESLLMAPARDVHLIGGKFLAVCIVSLITLILAVAATVVTVTVGGVEGMMLSDLAFAPHVIILGACVVIATVALMSSLAIAVSSFARSFREAQTYLTPIFMLVIMPGMIPIVAPHLMSVSALYFIPLFGNSFVFSDAAMGLVQPIHIGGVLVSNTLATGLLLWFSARALRDETARST